MSVISDLENYLESRPDEDIFELMYVLLQVDEIAKDWMTYKEVDIDEELEILDETLNEVLTDRRWLDAKEGRYETFVKYVHDHLLNYYNKLKEK